MIPLVPKPAGLKYRVKITPYRRALTRSTILQRRVYKIYNVLVSESFNIILKIQEILPIDTSLKSLVCPRGTGGSRGGDRWARPPESGWRPPSHLSEGLVPPLPRGSSDRSEIVSNGQKAGRKRVKVREYLSSFPFFLDHTWDTPTALRLTIDLATFSLILREFETGKRNFASGGSRPSDRGRGGGRAVIQTLR